MSDRSRLNSLMQIYLLILILTSNSVSTNLNKAVLYSRITILSLLSISTIVYYTLHIKPLESGIGLYNALFNISITSLSFNLFLLILTSIIAILTGFYSKKLYYITDFEKHFNYIGSHDKTKTNFLNNYITLFLNKNGFQFTIIEYSLITLFILSGAVLLISVGDLVSLFLSIELQSYGLYIIATIYRNSESATGSGLTYFLLGGLSSCFILLGSAILYVNSGMTNLDNIYILNSIDELNNYHSSSTGLDTMPNYVNFSLIVLTVGLLFKISAAPFHFWSPDVYDGIPTIVTTFVATIGKISLLILMLELTSYSDIDTNYNVLPTIEGNWKNILVLSSLMSLVVGSILGLTQYRIKRLFAYSTISHVGFILLALCINKIESIQGFIFYVLQYSICNLNAFFILITMGYTLYEYIYHPLIHKNMTSRMNKDKFIDIENSPVQLLSQIKGYFHINSFLSISFAITVFSFVGIPPLIGFFAKQMVLSAALDQGYVFMTLVAIITSVIGAAYYLNIVKLIFFSKSDYVKDNAIGNAIDYTQQDSLSNDYLLDKVESTTIVRVNDKLSIIISVLTMFILLFIFMPDEWFRIVNILSLSVNKY